MYERFIDDSNQVAVVPPFGPRFDQESINIVIEELIIGMNENNDNDNVF